MSKRAVTTTANSFYKPVLQKIWVFDGFELRKARQAHGLSMKKLGAIVGISAAYIHDLEHNRRSPSPETGKKLLEALGMPYAIEDKNK